MRSMLIVAEKVMVGDNAGIPDYGGDVRLFRDKPRVLRCWEDACLLSLS